jgi:hypothetical protein
MKRLASAFAMFCLMAMVVCMFSTKAHAGDYLGEYCWRFTNPPSGNTGTLKIGITSIGGGHFLCSGISTVDNYPENIWPPDGIFSVYGNAELVGNRIVITLSNAGARDGVIGNDMSVITLDPQTLNGTGKGIGVYSDKIEHSEYTATFIGCQ